MANKFKLATAADAADIALENRVQEKMQLKKNIRVEVEMQIGLSGKDILNWFNSCKDPELLKALGSAALKRAEALEQSNN